MTNPNNVLASIVALDDTKLTHSQRNRCMTLFALQENPFGMLSQWLYSRALERENSHTRTIEIQRQEIDEINSLKDFMLAEYQKMNTIIIQKQQETASLEKLLFNEINALKWDVTVTNKNRDLMEELHQLENLNKILLQSLYQAMREIQKLITLSN